jgi:4a-hydroxytetrahydrobiopterin dehydratase
MTENSQREAEPLVQLSCRACEGLEDRLSPDDANAYHQQVPDWTLSATEMNREFSFPDFKEAFAFATAIADLAEEQGHHPDITVGWGRCDVHLMTHAVKGLSVNDFVMAAHIDSLKNTGF